MSNTHATKEKREPDPAILGCLKEKALVLMGRGRTGCGTDADDSKAPTIEMTYVMTFCQVPMLSATVTSLTAVASTTHRD